MDNNVPNIFNTPLIPTQIEEWWKDKISNTALNKHASTLLISTTISENSAEYDQIVKMMTACKLDNEQYNILQLKPEDKHSWHFIRDWYNPKYVILFGILPIQISIHTLMILNDENSFDSTLWLPTVDLKTLLTDAQTKQQIWTKVLKKWFIK